MQLMAKRMKETDVGMEIKEAFQVFDHENSGRLTNDNLRMIMSTYGEKLTDEEIDEMIQEADRGKKGEINIQRKYLQGRCHGLKYSSVIKILKKNTPTDTHLLH